ncbi:MAG: 3-dehydroquinate synthase family protein [Candidatus Cryptobacteroides sp.]
MTDGMTDIKVIQCPLSQAAGKIGAMAAEAGCRDNIFIVHDRNVSGIVERLGLDAKGTFAIDGAEEAKSFETVVRICRWLMELGADRNAFVLGIGGGITTDMTGFAASVYKRGVKFAFLPTTLLAQVDAAIGGKNGVNLDSYKNMIGIIRQSEGTFICPEVLETLPYSQITSGAAEMLKTFIIDDSGKSYDKAVSLLEYVNTSDDKQAALRKQGPRFQKLIAAAASVKAGIAGRDPDEHGERRFLNLGHTFAHAIEKNSKERIGHGAAVSMGIILAARLAEELGVAKRGLASGLEADFRACGMPTVCPYSIESLAEAMKKDKKAEGQIVHFVLPVRIGQVITRELPVEEVVEALR